MKTTWGGPTVLPLSLSLSPSLSLSLCLSLSQSRGAPAAALPAAGDLRRGCGERAKASSQWAQPEKCLSIQLRQGTHRTRSAGTRGKWSTYVVDRRDDNGNKVLGTRAQDRSFGGRAPRRGGKRRGGGKGRWGAGGGGTVAVLSNVAVASWPESCPGHAWEDTGI